MVRPRSRSKGASGWQNWKGLLTLLLVLQPLVASALAGAYINRDMWGDWIRRLAQGNPGGGMGRGGLGAIAPREPTVVYYGPGQLSLGDFSIYIYDPVTKITLRTDFRLDSRAECENRQSFDAFVAMYHRLVREQVMTAVRNAPLEELTQSDHRLLKRRILTQVNLMLGQPFLKSVDLKNFSLWESADHMSFLPYQPPQTQQPTTWQ